MSEQEGLTTSQNVTAPKLGPLMGNITGGFDYQSECHCSKTFVWCSANDFCLTTSQNVTAPKRNVRNDLSFDELVSQANDVLSGKTDLPPDGLDYMKEIIIVDRSGKVRRIKKS